MGHITYEPFFCCPNQEVCPNDEDTTTPGTCPSCGSELIAVTRRVAHWDAEQTRYLRARLAGVQGTPVSPTISP